VEQYVGRTEKGAEGGWDADGRDGSQSAEETPRASEERLRTLVQFFFDVYWETDAQHRFTRQECSVHLADAPAAGSEIGKTRWEMPSLWANALRYP
jgi:hypothetical protein